MRFIYRAVIAMTIALCVSVPPSMASVGMLLIGYGAKSRGMGGATLALTEDSLVAAANPAGISFVEDRVDAGLLIFNPKRKATCCLSPNGQVSEEGWFFIPNMAATYRLDDKYSLGFAFVGYGGGRTEYAPNIFDAGATGPAGVNLEIALMSPSISYQIDKKQSVGASLLIGAARFHANGLDPFKTFSVHRDHVTDKGHDYSYGLGLRLGWLGHFANDALSLAATYQTEVNMSEFDEYKGLFAEGGDLDLPAIFSLGLAYKPVDDITLSFDWMHVYYEDVAALGNRSLPITTLPGDPRLMGQPDGPGFGWQDQDVFKLGLQYDYSSDWVLRGGIAYGEQPIRSDSGGGEFEFNVLAPAVTELHITGGATYALSSDSELTFGIMHAFNNSEEQFVPTGTGLPFENQAIKLEMEQWSWDVGYGYKF